MRIHKACNDTRGRERLELLQNILANLAFEYRNTAGALVGLPVLVLAWLVPGAARHPAVQRLSGRTGDIAAGALGLYALIGAAYLFYPNYLDYAEATIAALGLIVAQHGALYPAPERYPYHGLLYGPALAEIQATFSALDLPVVFRSKLSGLMLYLGALAVLLTQFRTALTRGYLLYLLPFGIMLFWNRSEPFILALVAIAIAIGARHGDRWWTPLAMGCAAGLASACKLHAAIYVAAAYLVCAPALLRPSRAWLLFAAAAAAVFFAAYAPAGVSFPAFLGYLRGGGAHGLSARLWLGNLGYLVFLLAPLAIMARQATLTPREKWMLGLVAGMELLVAAVAAKPGSGAHHLLPFIPVNAFILQRYLAGMSMPPFPVTALYLALLIPAATTARYVITPMAEKWQNMADARREVAQFGSRHAGLVMGMTDYKNSPLTYLRVLLPMPQIDYPGFMDLNASGETDAAMVQRLRSCAVPFLLMPRNGDAFSFKNLYSGRPMFSDATRQAFARHFVQADTGAFYAVYRCQL